MKKPSFARRHCGQLHRAAFAALFFGTFATTQHAGNAADWNIYNTAESTSAFSNTSVDDINIRRGSLTTGYSSELNADDVSVRRGSFLTTGARSDTYIWDINVSRGSSVTTGFRSYLSADDIDVNRGSSFTTGFRSELNADDVEVDRGSTFTTGGRSESYLDDVYVDRGSSFATGSRSYLSADDIDIDRNSSFTTGSRSESYVWDIDVDRGSSFTSGFRSYLEADYIDVDRGSSFTTGSRSESYTWSIEVDRGSSFTAGSRSYLSADNIYVERGSSFATGFRSEVRADDIYVDRGSSFTTGYRSELNADDVEVDRGSTFTTGARSETYVWDIDVERGSSFTTGYRSYLEADDIYLDRGASFTTGYRSTSYVDDIDINRGSSFITGERSTTYADDIDIRRGSFENNGYLNADDVDIRRGSSFFNSADASAFVDDISISRDGSLDNAGYLEADDIRIRRGGALSNWENAGLFADDIRVSRDGTLFNAGSLYADEISNRGTVINTDRIYVNGFYNASGTVVNNGTIDSNLFNGPDALLMGSGTITGSLFNAGTVSPGNSPGTIYVGGDFIHIGGAVLDLEVGSDSNYDQLIVGGTAYLEGDAVFSGNISVGGKYRFLKAASIVGEFANILIPDGFRIRILEKSTSLTALFAPETYSQMATNTNHRSVARALNRFIGAGGDRGTVSFALDELRADEYFNAFQQISPALHETVGTQAVNLTQQQGRLLQQRIGTARYGLRGGFQSTTVAPALQTDRDGKSVYQSKAVKEVVTVTEEPNRWSAWIEGNGVFSRVTQAQHVPNGRTRAGGFLVGTDYAWNPNFITGLFAGYEGLETKYTDESRVTMNGARFGGYGTYTLDNGLYFDGVVWGGTSQYDMHRRIKFGSIDRTANSKQNAGEVSAIFGTGYDWKPGNFIVGPTASVQYTYIGIDGFDENNAKSLNLDIERQRIHSLRSNLGARLAYRYQPTENVVLVPELRASWEYEFLNDSRDIKGSLAGKSISYRTEEGERSSLFAGAGINALFNNRVTTSVHYNVDLGRSNDTAHIISASFGVTW